MSMSRLFSITVLAILITACGQKGPLVLPDGAKPRDAHTRPADDDKPAADTPSSKRQTSGGQTSDDAAATSTDTEATTPSSTTEH